MVALVAVDFAGDVAEVAVDFVALIAGEGVIIGSSLFCPAGATSAGVSSTVADAFSSAAGAVDSEGAGDSSCANVVAARKSGAKNVMIIFM